MPGKFVVTKGSAGKFRWDLHGTNGRVIATSEAYESKASAMKGIAAVRRLAADAEVDDRTPKRAARAATRPPIELAPEDEGVLKSRHRTAKP